MALDRLDTLEPDDLRRFALAGSRYLLVEFPYSGWPLDIAARLFQLQVAGLVPVLAHPERNAEVKARPELLRSLVDAGALVQLTASSLEGTLGGGTQQTAFTLVKLGLAHIVASDAHGPAVRAVGLSGAVAELGGGELARWLTEAAPAAIVGNETLPRRPEEPPRKRVFSLRRR